MAERLVGEVGAGHVSRATAVVYRWMVLAAFLALFGAPTVLVWMALGLMEGVSPLFYVAALLPVAPALSAALYAQRAWQAEPDLRPARPLWRGLALNLKDVLAWWAPVLAFAGVLVAGALTGTVPGAEILRPIAAVLLIVVALWSGHLLVITSFFSFRTRDAMRIAASEFFTQWRATIAFACLAFVAAALVAVTSEAVLLLFAWVFALLLRLSSTPVETDVRSRFTR